MDGIAGAKPYPDKFSYTRKQRHVVIFVSSAEYLKNVDQEGYNTVLYLSASLRATIEISNFAKTWQKFSDELSILKELEVTIGHNFSGEKPDITIVSKEHNRDSDVGTAFVEKCVSTIEEYIYKSTDSNILPVLVDIPENLLDLIGTALIAKNYHTQRGLLAPSVTQMRQVCDLPSVCFFQFNEIEGSEFATVVVLMSWWNYQILENSS